jgi:hypothetical protein
MGGYCRAARGGASRPRPPTAIRRWRGDEPARVGRRRAAASNLRALIMDRVARSRASIGPDRAPST